MTAHTRTILGAICVAFFGVSICIAQSNGSQTITNWGENVNGVQLSIALPNKACEKAQMSTKRSLCQRITGADLKKSSCKPGEQEENHEQAHACRGLETTWEMPA